MRLILYVQLGFRLEKQQVYNEIQIAKSGLAELDQILNVS
jgi:hypothetical protein